MEAAVVERAFLRVRGPDAESYLQGQLSQDVSSGGGLSFLLDPSGKVVTLLRFAGEGDGFLLDTDATAGDVTEARLRRFLLRVKVEIEVERDRRLVRVFDGPELPQARIVSAWSDAGSVQDVVEGAAGDLSISVTADEYERRRIAAGVPVAGVDIGPDTIPAEVGRWAIERAVSFTKGCYTGQELVARIASRGGNVPRPLRVIRFDGAAAVAGDELLDHGGEPVGHVTSAAADVALGPVMRRVEIGAELHTAGGARGVVER